MGARWIRGDERGGGIDVLERPSTIRGHRRVPVPRIEGDVAVHRSARLVHVACRLLLARLDELGVELEDDVLAGHGDRLGFRDFESRAPGRAVKLPFEPLADEWQHAPRVDALWLVELRRKRKVLHLEWLFGHGDKAYGCLRTRRSGGA